MGPPETPPATGLVRGAARTSARVGAEVLGWLGVTVGVVGLLARSVAVGWQPAIVAAAASVYFAGGAAVGGALLAVRRRRAGVLVAAAVVVVTAVVHVPWFVTPHLGGAGTGIWSRYPLTGTVAHDEFRFELLTARVEVPGAVPVAVAAVHLLPPWPYPSSTWLG